MIRKKKGVQWIIKHKINSRVCKHNRVGQKEKPGSRSYMCIHIGYSNEFIQGLKRKEDLRNSPHMMNERTAVGGNNLQILFLVLRKNSSSPQSSVFRTQLTCREYLGVFKPSGRDRNTADLCQQDSQSNTTYVPQTHFTQIHYVPRASLFYKCILQNAMKLTQHLYFQPQSTL